MCPWPAQATLVHGFPGCVEAQICTLYAHGETIRHSSLRQSGMKQSALSGKKYFHYWDAVLRGECRTKPLVSAGALRAVEGSDLPHSPMCGDWQDRGMTKVPPQTQQP